MFQGKPPAKKENSGSDTATDGPAAMAGTASFGFVGGSGGNESGWQVDSISFGGDESHGGDFDGDLWDETEVRRTNSVVRVKNFPHACAVTHFLGMLCHFIFNRTKTMVSVVPSESRETGSIN